jgi:hypothetical protein
MLQVEIPAQLLCQLPLNLHATSPAAAEAQAAQAAAPPIESSYGDVVAQ